jgi:hypothetical protein
VDFDKTKAVETEPGTDMPLVRDIRSYVLAFRTGGIETLESCEGGKGHAFAEPTLRESQRHADKITIAIYRED